MAWASRRVSTLTSFATARRPTRATSSARSRRRCSSGSQSSTRSEAARRARIALSIATTKMSLGSTGGRARRALRPRLPGDLAHLRRATTADDPRHRAADSGLRRRRLRALGGEHVLHPGRPTDRARRSWLQVTAGIPDTSGLTWSAFLVDNLIPVTIGSMIGGGCAVGAVYWFVYLRPRPGLVRRGTRAAGRLTVGSAFSRTSRARSSGCG